MGSIFRDDARRKYRVRNGAIKVQEVWDIDRFLSGQSTNKRSR